MGGWYKLCKMYITVLMKCCTVMHYILYTVQCTIKWCHGVNVPRRPNWIFEHRGSVRFCSLVVSHEEDLQFPHWRLHNTRCNVIWPENWIVDFTWIFDKQIMVMLWSHILDQISLGFVYCIVSCPVYEGIKPIAV